jgi:hypothetical protein
VVKTCRLAGFERPRIVAAIEMQWARLDSNMPA